LKLMAEQISNADNEAVLEGIETQAKAAFDKAEVEFKALDTDSATKEKAAKDLADQLKYQQQVAGTLKNEKKIAESEEKMRKLARDLDVARKESEAASMLKEKAEKKKQSAKGSLDLVKEKKNVKAGNGKTADQIKKERQEEFV